MFWIESGPDRYFLSIELLVKKLESQTLAGTPCRTVTGFDPAAICSDLILFVFAISFFTIFSAIHFTAHFAIHVTSAN